MEPDGIKPIFQELEVNYAKVGKGVSK